MNSEQRLPVHDMESEYRPIEWSRLAGYLIAVIIVACAAAVLVAGTVRLFVMLWP